MTWLRRRAHKEVHSSEKGLLELVGRDREPTLRERIIKFRDLVSEDMDWTDSRKARFRKRAATISVATLVLTAASTVVLGLQVIPARASIALPLVARR